MRVHCNAESVFIEEGSFGAGFTDSVNEVAAERVGGSKVNAGGSGSGRSDHAASVLESIAGVAGSAGTVVSVPFSALVVDGDADPLSIEKVFGRAPDTLTVLPLSAAAELRAVEGLDGAGTVGVDEVAGVAAFADTDVPVEGHALRVDFAADSVVVEDVVL